MTLKKSWQTRSLSKASFTVETALLMPVILFTIFAALYLTAHLHNRSCLYAGAAEQAISGHEQAARRLFASGEISVSRDDAKDRREVIQKTETLHFTGRKLYTVDEKAVYRKYHPVSLIRRKNAAGRLTDDTD